MNIEQLKDGVLCSLKIGRWNASTKIDPKAISDTAPREILRTMQDMLTDKTYIKEIATIRNTTNYALKTNSLLFPVEELKFVPKAKIGELNDLFTQNRREHRLAVERLIKNMTKLRNKFQKEYPEHYELIKHKYPTADEIRAKFHFSWNFFQMQLPDKNAGVLEPAVYKREAKKFQKMVREMEQMTVNMIGNMLHERIKKLEEQCDEGSVNAATVKSVDNFLEKWEDLWSGHIDQTEFKRIVDTVRKQMKKTTIESLKENEEVRGKLRDQLSKIVDRIENVKAIDLKRKIVM